MYAHEWAESSRLAAADTLPSIQIPFFYNYLQSDSLLCIVNACVVYHILNRLSLA